MFDRMKRRYPKPTAWNGTKDERPDAYYVAKHAKMDKSLYLPEACADFYVLERLWADGDPEARRIFPEYEAYLARQLFAYMDVAVGGELSHAIDNFTSDESADCNGYDSCCGFEHDCDELDHHEGWSCTEAMRFNEYYAAWLDDYRNADYGSQYRVERAKHVPNVQSFLAIACGQEHCWENGEWINSDYCECGDCYACGRERSESGRYALDPVLRAYVERRAEHRGELRGRKGRKFNDRRSFFWNEWLIIRRRHGSDALRLAYQSFKHDPWKGSYGGESWAAIAKLALDWLEGRISDRVFVNMAWSMEHNGGNVFNKLYQISGYNDQSYGDQASAHATMTDKKAWPSLMTTLIVQASDPTYERLVHGCSDKVYRMFAYQRYLRSTKQGRKVLAERAHYQTEMLERGYALAEIA